MASNLIQLETPAEKAFREARAGFIGGSDAASMYNLGHGCHRRLVYDKRGTPVDFQRTPDELELMQRGHDLEDVAADKFAAEMHSLLGPNVRVQKMSRPFVSKAHPHAGVNMDRRIVGVRPDQFVELFGSATAASGPGVLEVKSENEFVFKKTLATNQLPQDNVIQLQHALAVTGYQWGAFAILGYGPRLWKLEWFAVLRDQVLCSDLLRRTDETWRLVELGPLPEPLPAGDSRCRSCQYRRTCLGERMWQSEESQEKDWEADESLSLNVGTLLQVRARQKELTAEEQILEAAVKEQMGAREKVEVPSLGARISYKLGKPPLCWDTKALEAEAGTIGRKVAFADWVQTADPQLVTEFCKQNPSSPSLEASFKRAGTPSRPLKLLTE